VRDEFRVKESASGYRVELWRGDQPYVTFIDGLTRQGAEREAHSLAALWARISIPQPVDASVRVAENSVSLDRPRGRPNAGVVGDWT
jgi:hypothetical protein